MNIDREELAWAAGFYEGEGYCGSSKRSKSKVYSIPVIDIVQVDVEPLEKFRQCVLGIGKIRGPYAAYHGDGSIRRRPSYRYTTNKFSEAQVVVSILWPWLSRRRKNQIKLAMTNYLHQTFSKRGPKPKRVRPVRFAA